MSAGLHSATARLLEQLAGDSHVGVALHDADRRFLYVNRALAALNGLPEDDHLGRRVEDVIPRLADPVAGLLDAVLASGEALRDVPIAMDDRSWRASYHPLDVGGERVVGVVVEETTDQRRAERLAERRARQQALVAHLGRLALSRAGIGTLLDAAADGLRDALGVDFVSVHALDLEHSRLHPLAARGWPMPDGHPGVPFAPDSLTAYALRTRGPVIVDDLREERRFAPVRGALAAGVVCGMATLVEGRERPFGLLTVAGREPRAFTPDDADVLSSVANVLAAGIERDRAEAELTQLAALRAELVVEARDAAEGERRRLSEDLHDHVLQDLLFLRQELAAVADELGDDRVRRLAGDLRDVARTLRRVVIDVHPLTLQHEGLEAALRELAAERSRHGALEIELDLAPGAAGAHDEVVLATARELLTNVVKHARARRAVLRLTHERDVVRLVVEDDGVGFDLHEVRARPVRGMGLTSCARRVEAAGGRLRAEARRPRGTRVLAELPLRGG